MMALLCLALYAIRVPLPIEACWLVVIGGFTNPSLFLLRAVDPRPQIGVMRKAYRVACFAAPTVGFTGVACSILLGL
jgi:hypothetical protein